MQRFLIKILLFAALMVAVEALLSLEWELESRLNSVGEPEQKWKPGIPDRDAHTPDPMVQSFQPYLELHPHVGFLWKPNLGAEASVHLTWADQDAAPVNTDRWGFQNPPYALEESRAGRKPDIIGIGASFMQGTGRVWNDFFYAKGEFYYNMGVHRHTFPQYNWILEHHALPLDPEWILYGINEFSVELEPHFRQWKASGMDWFTFHSGSWSGPPVERHWWLDWLDPMPALRDLAYAVKRRVIKTTPLSSGDPKERARLVLEYIVEANRLCQEKGVAFMPLFIPGKKTVFYEWGDGMVYFDMIAEELEDRGIPFVDLRKPFADEKEPRALYYVNDGHWNEYGMSKAALAIARAIVFEP